MKDPVSLVAPPPAQGWWYLAISFPPQEPQKDFVVKTVSHNMHEGDDDSMAESLDAQGERHPWPRAGGLLLPAYLHVQGSPAPSEGSVSSLWDERNLFCSEYLSGVI